MCVQSIFRDQLLKTSQQGCSPWGCQVPTIRYLFDVVDTDGTVKQMDEVVLPDITAALERVAQIGGRIDRPGCRIRVKDANGSVVFVGITTDQVSVIKVFETGSSAK